MLAISLKQPWASLIFTPQYDESGKFIKFGRKTIETRYWTPYVKGEILICSSQKPDMQYWPLPALRGVCRVCGKRDVEFLDRFEDLCVDCPHKEYRGYCLGSVEITHVRRMVEENQDAACIRHNPQLYSWFLTNARPLKKPFPMRGNLKFFDLDVDDENLEFLDKPL
jgi:hypothetical protein